MLQLFLKKGAKRSLSCAISCFQTESGGVSLKRYIYHKIITLERRFYNNPDQHLWSVKNLHSFFDRLTHRLFYAPIFSFALSFKTCYHS